MRSKIVVCASGEGTNFESIVAASRSGKLHAEVVGLIVNRENSNALGRAHRLSIPTSTLTLKSFPDRPQWDQAMVTQLQNWGADWVALAGFLALIGPRMLAAYPDRIVNSHPALLPKHGGEGMYGLNVHRSVLNSGDTETGVTIHLIDEHFDRGRILAQEKLQVNRAETAELLEARVKAIESRLYPKVLNDLVRGRPTSG